MSKIVCDICGTTYDDAAGSCPVCGWNPGKSLDVNAADDVDDILNLNFEDTPAAEPQPLRPASRGKAALDTGAAMNARRRPAKPAPVEEDDEDEEEEEEEESGSNTFLVIVLVLLILALLAVSAYIGWTKLIKPRMGSDKNKPQDTISSQVAETDPVIDLPTAPSEDPASEPTAEPETEPTEAGVPCTNLSLVGPMDTLTFKGQYWRVMVNKEPEDTTDKVIFTSGDENVVTIDEYGRVTAVGEGETVIIITCGAKRIETPAVVKYPVTATEPVVGEGTETAGTGTTSTVATPSNDPILKLKKTDVTIGRKGVYITLELENGISADDVKWSTSDSSVATVWNGNVTAIGRGYCVVTAEYKGQKAQCVVRVSY